MSEGPQARKDRLAAMRAEASHAQLPAVTQRREGESGEEVVVKLRNYVPYDASLLADGDYAEEAHSAKRRRADDGDVEARESDSASKPKKKTDKGTDLIRMELSKTSTREEAPVAARKVDHDLKLQAAHKLSKLQKRTQRSIVDILRQRLVNGDE